MAETLTRRIHGLLMDNPNKRHIIFPVPDAGGVGVALGAAGNSPAWSAWVDVILLAGVTLETLVDQVTLDTHSAACVATVEIGSTISLGVAYATAAAVNAAGAPAIAGAARYQFRAQLIAIAAGQGYVVNLPTPIYIPAGTGILARWQTAAGAETANITVGGEQNWR